MSDHCPEHSGNCVRIDNLEERMDRIETKVGNPTIVVAVITTMGVMFSSTAAFAGVILAPVIRAYLGIN